jgi:hypothetical protein
MNRLDGITKRANANPSPSDLGVIDHVIPSSMKFTTPKAGPIGIRNEIRLSPVNDTYSTNANNIVRFFFQNSGLVDFRRGYIAFDLTISGTSGGTYTRLSQGVWSIFNRVRLLCGKELEDIREYNLLHSTLFEIFRDEEVGAVIGPSCYGYATREIRQQFAATTKSYAMPLMCGFFLSGVVPMGKLKDRLVLEMYMADPRQCIETDGSPNNLAISITNIYFHYEMMSLTDNMENEYARVADSGIVFPYKKMSYYVQPVTNAVSNLVIPHVGSFIEAILNIFRNSNNLNTTTINDKFLTWQNPAVTQHQFRINNIYFPPEQVYFDGTDPRSYVQFLRFVGKWRLGGVFRNPPSITLEEYALDKFIIVNDLETYPGEGLVNPISTEGSATFMYQLLWFSANPPVGLQMDTFVQSYDSVDLSAGKLQ